MSEPPAQQFTHAHITSGVGPVAQPLDCEQYTDMLKARREHHANQGGRYSKLYRWFLLASIVSSLALTVLMSIPGNGVLTVVKTAMAAMPAGLLGLAKQLRWSELSRHHWKWAHMLEFFEDEITLRGKSPADVSLEVHKFRIAMTESHPEAGNEEETD